MNQCLDYNKNNSVALRGIVQPFLDQMFLSEFIFIKLYEDKRMYISTNDNWVEKYLEFELYNNKKHEVTAIERDRSFARYAIWDLLPKDRVFQCANDSGMHHGFIIYDKNEIFSFATKSQNDRVNAEYLSNIDLFEKFIFYFRERMSGIMQNYSEDVLIKTQPLIKPKAKKIISELEVKNYRFNDGSKITNKEFEVLKLLSYGMVMKEAAFALNISSKTIEYHMDNLKTKLNCCTKGQLIRRFQDKVPSALW